MPIKPNTHGEELGVSAPVLSTEIHVVAAAVAILFDTNEAVVACVLVHEAGLMLLVVVLDTSLRIGNKLTPE